LRTCRRYRLSSALNARMPTWDMPQCSLLRPHVATDVSPTGLWINFNVPRLRDGLERFVR
jgi:hypothetical protein